MPHDIFHLKTSTTVREKSLIESFCQGTELMLLGIPARIISTNGKQIVSPHCFIKSVNRAKPKYLGHNRN